MPAAQFLHCSTCTTAGSWLSRGQTDAITMRLFEALTVLQLPGCCYLLPRRGTVNTRGGTSTWGGASLLPLVANNRDEGPKLPVTLLLPLAAASLCARCCLRLRHASFDSSP